MKYKYLIFSLSLILMACEQENNKHQSYHVDSNEASVAKSHTAPNQTINRPKQVEIPIYPENHQQVLSKIGYQSIEINAPFDTNKYTEIQDSRLDDCFYAESKAFSKAPIEIQVIGNKIVVISTTDPQFSSYTGARVGDSIEQVFKKHDNHPFEKVINPYGDGVNQYSIIYWNEPSKKIGTRYDVDANKVIEIYVGKNDELYLMEGCA